MLFHVKTPGYTPVDKTSTPYWCWGRLVETRRRGKAEEGLPDVLRSSHLNSGCCWADRVVVGYDGIEKRNFHSGRRGGQYTSVSAIQIYNTGNLCLLFLLVNTASSAGRSRPGTRMVGFSGVKVSDTRTESTFTVPALLHLCNAFTINFEPIKAYGSADPSVFPEFIYPPPRTSRIRSTSQTRYRGQPHARAETIQGRYGAAGSPRQGCCDQSMIDNYRVYFHIAYAVSPECAVASLQSSVSSPFLVVQGSSPRKFYLLNGSIADPSTQMVFFVWARPAGKLL